VQEGRIAIIVLHDLTFAARWADNIVVMADGKPEYIGAE
jgi:ABC-type hemin transport system ATPase subunit